MRRNAANPLIEHTYRIANGLMLCRMQQGESVWYRFIECTGFDLEYYRGNTDLARYEITLE